MESRFNLLMLEFNADNGLKAAVVAVVAIAVNVRRFPRVTMVTHEHSAYVRAFLCVFITGSTRLYHHVQTNGYRTSWGHSADIPMPGDKDERLPLGLVSQFDRPTIVRDVTITKSDTLATHRGGLLADDCATVRKR